MARNKMKITTLLAAITILLAACTEEQAAEQRIPIQLTSSIASTRGVANPTQEDELVGGEKVFVWANEEIAAGTPDWTQNAYLKAWTLTAGASGALTGSTQYYPAERTLSMVAIHGNFSFTEGTDAYPGFVEHSVAADQDAAGGYEKSDLMWWSDANVTASSNEITVGFGHKLSKIEITLVPNTLYSEDDLDKATVQVCNVIPTVSMNLADGSISAAYGAPINITPRKTGKVDYEVILPPQQKPLDMIQVNLGGTIIKVDAQVTEFDANTKYPYEFDFTYKDVRKNPLWYVAEYNVNYDGASTYSWATTPSEGSYFTWAEAMSAFTTSRNTSSPNAAGHEEYLLGTGSKFSGWHLPTRNEWRSIIPVRSNTGKKQTILGTNEENALIFTPGEGKVFENPQTYVSFGYNDETAGTNRNYMEENSYWYRKSSTVMYAIRYCESEYCSAWKYETRSDALIISSTLLGRSLTASEASTQFGTDASKWEAIYFGNNEAIGAVQRTFSYNGYYDENSDFVYYGTHCNFWSASTGHSSNSHHFALSRDNGLNIHHNKKTWKQNIRLFRDNSSFVDLLKNPLWYVANTNMYNNGTKYVLAESPKEGSLLTWYEAMKQFTNEENISAETPTSISGYYTRQVAAFNGNMFGWHLPIMQEWNSIAPCQSTTGQNDLWELFPSGEDKVYDQITYLCFGYNDATKGTGGSFMTEKSYWYRPSDNVLYAVRYCDSEFCSVWKYEQNAIAGNKKNLTISCTLLPSSISTSQAESIYGKTVSNWESVFFGNDASKGALQLTMYAIGLSKNDGGVFDLQMPDEIVAHWSATQTSAGYAYTFAFHDRSSTGLPFRTNMWHNQKWYSMAIRMFRDN